MNTTLKEKILSLHQEKIYSLYFGISVDDVTWSASNPSNKLSNPYREDVNPSLSFAWFNNKLIARDFADPAYSGDIFKVIGYIINLNYRHPSHFIEICNDILIKTSGKTHKISNEYEIIKKEKAITNIDIRIRIFQKRDYDYFRLHGIRDEMVQRFAVPVMRYSINGRFTNYTNSYKDPCYKYNVNHKFIKLYFPNRLRHSSVPRFITNNILPMDDIVDIVHSNDIILCKSIKDKMLLLQMLESLNIQDICVLTASSETSQFTSKILDILKRHTNHGIYSIFDTDKVGLSCMDSLKSDCNIEPIIFSPYAKDPTDTVKSIGYIKTYDIFKQHIDRIINNRITINKILNDQ